MYYLSRNCLDTIYEIEHNKQNIYEISRFLTNILFINDFFIIRMVNAAIVLLHVRRYNNMKLSMSMLYTVKEKVKRVRIWNFTHKIILSLGLFYNESIVPIFDQFLMLQIYNKSWYLLILWDDNRKKWIEEFVIFIYR